MNQAPSPLEQTLPRVRPSLFHTPGVTWRYRDGTRLTIDQNGCARNNKRKLTKAERKAAKRHAIRERHG